jgi:deoxyribodipyrimidine photo-lyase
MHKSQRNSVEKIEPAATTSPPSPKNDAKQIGLFLFRRDLRIVDNIGFSNALRDCDTVYPCFIFTPEQVSSKNAYKSNNCIQFMIESLCDLDQQIKSETGGNGRLICVYGGYMEKIKELVKTLHITHIYFNEDYTPYSKKRDKEIAGLCDKMDIHCVTFHDYLLYKPGDILTGSGKPYQKYTPFYEKVMEKIHRTPPLSPMKKHTKSVYAKVKKGHGGLDNELNVSLVALTAKFIGKEGMNEKLNVHGGRKLGIKQMEKALNGSQEKYDEKRDTFMYETTYMSAYLKFGCVSVREFYSGIVRKYGKNSGLVRELIWREFFMHVLYAYPELLKGAFIEKYRGIQWRHSTSDFNKWKSGNTGVPLVDACMRQMNTTGYMHNRGRMVVATFLTKTLLLNWQLGEKYFAQTLVDYDPASNNGNWQSIASTGVDMKPYYRDMNPYIQSAKFDKDAEYVKKWVPELENVSSRDIHHWETACLEKRNEHVKYSKPMVNYAEQKELMLKLYKNA